MENRTLKISVITAAYNSGKTIEDTLKRVFGQTYPDVEHIIKDGGSKDDTLEICERYRREFYAFSESSSQRSSFSSVRAMISPMRSETS